MKAKLFQRRRCMMNESEKFCLWSRFAAVTRMECVDHRLKSGSEVPMFRTAEAASLRCFAVRESVMKALFSPLVWKTVTGLCGDAPSAVHDPVTAPCPRRGASVSFDQ